MGVFKDFSSCADMVEEGRENGVSEKAIAEAIHEYIKEEAEDLVLKLQTAHEIEVLESLISKERRDEA